MDYHSGSEAIDDISISSLQEEEKQLLQWLKEDKTERNRVKLSLAQLRERLIQRLQSDNEDLQKRLEEVQSDREKLQKQLNDQKEILRFSYKEKQQLVESLESKCRFLDEELQKANRLKGENYEIKKQKESLDKEIKEMKEQKETDEKKQKIEIESQKADFLEREKNYKKNIEGLQTDLDAEKRQNKTLNQNAGELRKYGQSLGKSNLQLQMQVEECDRQILDLNEHITNLRGENKQLKSRVSELAGAKLMDNNPDIADLSDPNRALKRGEKFSSLYDDDWTDAFQTLTEKYQMKDHETIRLLLDILLRSYQHCRKVADEQMDSLYIIFENPCQNIAEMLTFPKDKTQLTQKQHKDLKDLRERIALNQSESVAKLFLNKEYEEAKKKGDRKQKKILDETKIYYEKCVEVCWPMVLHDPPINLEMKVNPGVKIDGNRFRLYGGNGDTLEYLVWPPLVVEGGGLLAKGVAKPKEVKRTEKKP